MKDRLDREKNTVELMINIYCKKVHRSDSYPCNKCQDLIDYAFKRIDNCTSGHKKPVCGKCKIHCYKPPMRADIKVVMRKAGPKMFIRHPIITINHMIDLIRYSNK